MLAISRRWIGLVSGLFLLTGCSFADAVLWPSLTGEFPKDGTENSVSQVEIVEVESDLPQDGGTWTVVDPDILASEPFVVIRFADDDVDYQDSLQQAVDAALERKPDARFDLIAVASAAGSPDEVALNSSAVHQNAEDVRRSMIDMGLSDDRLRLSEITSADAQVKEVRIYVR